MVKFPLSNDAWDADPLQRPPTKPNVVSSVVEDTLDVVAQPAIKHRFSVVTPECTGAMNAHFCYSAFSLCHEADGGQPHPYCDSAALDDAEWPSSASPPPRRRAHTPRRRKLRARRHAEEDTVVCPPWDEEHGLQLACMRTQWGPLCTTVSGCHTPGGDGGYDEQACRLLTAAVRTFPHRQLADAHHPGPVALRRFTT